METSFKITSSEESQIKNQKKPNFVSKKISARYLVAILLTLLLFFVVMASLGQNNTPSNQTSQTETTTQQSKDVANIPEPKNLGKWFGESTVFVGKTDNGYLATFDPALPKGSLFIPPKPDNFKGAGIYAYMINLANDTYGSQLTPSMAKPEFTESNGTTLITYATNDGSTIYFLPMKDEANQVFGIGFWKK